MLVARRLLTLVLIVVAALPTLLLGVLTLDRGTEIVLTRLRPDLYLSRTLVIRTYRCEAPADRTTALLVLRGRIVFPTGEVCPCTLSSRTSAADRGATHFAENPHGTPADPPSTPLLVSC